MLRTRDTRSGTVGESQSLGGYGCLNVVRNGCSGGALVALRCPRGGDGGALSATASDSGAMFEAMVSMAAAANAAPPRTRWG
jgi:hypothetical protein